MIASERLASIRVRSRLYRGKHTPRNGDLRELCATRLTKDRQNLEGQLIAD